MGSCSSPGPMWGQRISPPGTAGREAGLGCGWCQAARPPWRQDEGLAQNLVVRPRGVRALERECPYTPQTSHRFALMGEDWGTWVAYVICWKIKFKISW